MKKLFNICNVYIIIWCLYDLQNVLGYSGGWLSQGLLAVNLLLSIYYAFITLTKYKISPYLKALTAMIIMFTLYGGLLMLTGERITKYGHVGDITVIGNFTYLKSIYVSLLPIYPFYVFTKRGLLTEKSIRWWLVVFIFVATQSFFFKKNEAIMMALSVGSDREEFTNNAGYLFLALLPLTVFLRKTPLLQYVAMAYCMVFLIMGMKRGAIIIGAIGLLIIIYYSAGKFNTNRRYRFMILSVVLIAVGYYVVQYYLATSDYFNHRLETTLEGGTSNRDYLYSTFWNYFLYDTGPLQFFLGSGANATLKIAGQYAHNDWLELAINQGFLGISVYLIYWMTAFKEWKNSNRRETYSLVIGLIFIIYFLKTFFSMSYGDMEYYTTMALGYCLAQKKNTLSL